MICAVAVDAGGHQEAIPGYSEIPRPTAGIPAPSRDWRPIGRLPIINQRFAPMISRRHLRCVWFQHDSVP
jgi:hypothetical protein